MTELSAEPVDLEPAELTLAPLPVAVLTAPGGPHAIKEDLRQVLAMTADGKLYISPQHVSDPYVMAFMDQLEHKGIDYEVVLASMTEIKTLYQASASRGMKALVETQRQAQVVEFMGTPTGAAPVMFTSSFRTMSPGSSIGCMGSFRRYARKRAT
ncbi:hypothetical protein AB5975_02895 [Pseudomonas putida]